MPRPKRTKVASKPPIGSKAPIAASKPTTSTNTASRTTRTTRAAPSQDDISDSDAESNTNAKPVLRERRETWKRPSTANTNNTSGVTLTLAQQRTLTEATRRKDKAMAALEKENLPTSESTSLLAAVPVADAIPTTLGDEIESSPEMEYSRRVDTTHATTSTLSTRRRPRQPSILGKATMRDERSPSIESDLAASQPLDSIPRNPSRTSLLLQSGVKRRQRKGSILGQAIAMRSDSVEPEPLETTTAAEKASRTDSTSTDSLYGATPLKKPNSGRASFGTSANTGNGTSTGLGTGLFKRRARQGSILAGTPAGQGRSYGGDDTGLGFTDDEGGFNPEDESTPLGKGKGVVRASVEVEAAQPNPRKRKSSPLQDEDEQDDDAHNQRFSSPGLDITPEPELPHLLNEGGEGEDEEARIPSSPTPLPSTPPRQSSILSTPPRHIPQLSLSPSPAPLPQPGHNEQYDEEPSSTNAPPRSSSSMPSSPGLDLTGRTGVLPRNANPSTNRRNPSRRAVTPAYDNEDDLPSSPPSLTHSPDLPASKRSVAQKARPEPAALSTAQLKALLPRRRVRPVRTTGTGEFDFVDSSEEELEGEGEGEGEDSDVDELVLGTRSRRAGSAAPGRGRRGARKVTRLRSAITGRGRAVERAEAAAAASASAKSARSHGGRTYGKENASYAEDDDLDPDDSLAPLPVESEDEEEGEGRARKAVPEHVSQQLEKVREKFAEVDEWEMEFEEATGSSSPRDAR